MTDVTGPGDFNAEKSTFGTDMQPERVRSKKQSIKEMMFFMEELGVRNKELECERQELDEYFSTVICNLLTPRSYFLTPSFYFVSITGNIGVGIRLSGGSCVS
jgi:hypothetical protein